MAGIELPRRLPAGGGGRRAAQAPTASDVQRVGIQRDPGVTAPAGAFGGQAGEALAQAGQGLTDFGASLAQVSERLQAAKRKTQVASATARATADMRAFVLDLENDPNAETYGPRFEERAKTAFETYSDGLDEAGQQQFRSNFEVLTLEQAYQVRKLANGRAVDAATANLDGALDTYADVAATAGTDKEYLDSVDQAMQAITDAEEAGVIDAVEAGKRRRGFASRLDEVKVMQEITKDPERASEMLTDPSLFPNLDEKRRQSLLDSAISKADTAQRRKNAEMERQERLAEKRLNAEGEALLKEAYDLMDAGGQPNQDQLDALKHHEGVSPSEYRGVLTQLEKADTVEDDPATVAYLQSRLHAEDISRDLNAALDEELLKPSTYRTMFNQNKAALSDNRPASPFKSGRTFLDEALDPGQLGGDSFIRQALTLAQQNAVADYDTWFEDNQDATRAQAMEQARALTEQYQNVAFGKMRLALPRPRGYSGSKQNVTMEAIEAARRAIGQEVANDRLTNDLAAREIEQLNVWERILNEGRQ